ncbi:MAG: hypothetical protein ACK5KM_13615 [Hyphomicrobiaceae bacterium]
MTLRTLADAIEHYGREAYLLTIAADGPHTSNVTIDFHDGLINCVIGNSAAKNIAGDTHVSLFWPPAEPSDYAMILNGKAKGLQQTAGATQVQITITKSVLHRPGPKPADSDGPCASDCRRLSR